MCTAPTEWIPLVLPNLPYPLDALEPIISKEILEIHYGKHHKAYVDNYNKNFQEIINLSKKNQNEKISILLNNAKFHLGGHKNHALYWENLKHFKENTDNKPNENLVIFEYIKKKFNSFENFVNNFNLISAGIMGSGWGWLGYDKKTDSISIVTSKDQDDLEGTTGLIPLLTIDVWEHAYYLQYQNRRLEYLQNIWKIVNWEKVEQRLISAK